MVSLPEYRFIVDLCEADAYKKVHDELYDTVVDISGGDCKSPNIEEVIGMADEMALQAARKAYAKAVKDVCRLAKSGVDITLLATD